MYTQVDFIRPYYTKKYFLIQLCIFSYKVNNKKKLPLNKEVFFTITFDFLRHNSF